MSIQLGRKNESGLPPILENQHPNIELIAGYYLKHLKIEQ